jgi:hypothetical protein
MPTLPTIVYGRVVDGVPALTVNEHVRLMHAYAQQYAAQEVAKEREACAKLVEKMCSGKWVTVDKMAEAIRSRTA